MDQEVTGLHCMQWTSIEGDTTITWNPEDPASVEEARAKFAELRGQGYAAFRMNVIEEDGIVVEEKGEAITTFDPQAGHIMLTQQLRGG